MRLESVSSFLSTFLLFMIYSGANINKGKDGTRYIFDTICLHIYYNFEADKNL